MICDYLLPVESKTLYNQHKHLDFEPKFHTGKQISQDFISLASTSRKAHWLCQNAFKPKNLRRTIGGFKFMFHSMEIGVSEEESEGQIERLSRGLLLPYYQTVQ